MNTQTDELTAIARELAERRWVHNPEIWPNPDPAEPYDTRFAAMRGEHEWGYGAEGEPGDCVHCGDAFDFTEHLYCLRTDLGAIVRCAAACGFVVQVQQSAAEWLAVVARVDQQLVGMTGGNTPELAAIRALKAAVE